MGTFFEETVDVAEDGSKTAEKFFNDQEEKLSTAAKIIRPLGIFLTILGIYLLFSPIMSTLAWIPLIGGLLSNVVAFAAFLTALIVGGTISCLVIGVAWVFFRPLVGVPLLAATIVGFYFIFFYGEGDASVASASA